MRKQPFTLSSETSNSSGETTATIQDQDKIETVQQAAPISLADRLKNRPKIEEEIIEEQTPAGEEPPILKEGEEPTKDAKAPPIIEDTSSFEDFKENIVKKKLKDFAIKPEKLSAFLVKAFNGARIFFLPGLYAKLSGMSEEEVKDATAAKAKRTEAEKKNETPVLTKYEERMLRRLDNLEEARDNVSYTSEEIAEFSKLIAGRISDMDVPGWMDKYDWLLFLLYVEWMHASKLVYDRGANMLQNKIGS